jgi:hypothetical protein
MIKIFDNEKEAQELCSEIHKWLTENCKGYAASKWQDPVPDEKKLKWYVQLPAEYDYELKEEKEMYPVAEPVSLAVKSFSDKAKETVSKLPADWVTIKAAGANEELIEKP